MTTRTESAAGAPGWRDYLELCKPNVVLVMIVTAVIGMFMAVPGMVPLDILVLGNLGIALCAAAAAAINHLVDRHIDRKMARTRNRPLPSGRLAPQRALIFGLSISALGLLVVTATGGWLAGWMGLRGLFACGGLAILLALWWIVAPRRSKDRPAGMSRDADGPNH